LISRIPDPEFYCKAKNGMIPYDTNNLDVVND
jgi:hypothetical protein